MRAESSNCIHDDWHRFSRQRGRSLIPRDFYRCSMRSGESRSRSAAGDGTTQQHSSRHSSKNYKFPCRRWRSSGGLRRCWTGRRRCGPSAAPPSPNSTPSPNPSSSTSSATPPPTRKAGRLTSLGRSSPNDELRTFQPRRPTILRVAIPLDRRQGHRHGEARLTS